MSCEWMNERMDEWWINKSLGSVEYVYFVVFYLYLSVYASVSSHGFLFDE